MVAEMGLFDGIKDYFSDEAKAKREAEKQRMLEEQEEAYREVLARRRSPEMMEAVCNGTVFPEVKIHLIRNSEGSGEQTYYEYTLTNAFIKSYTT